VRFENVSFTYPGATEPAVRDVSLHLRPGHSLALVGENGSGKTTLIKLLTRLYVPSSGRILLDGLDLASGARWRCGARRRHLPGLRALPAQGGREHRRRRRRALRGRGALARGRREGHGRAVHRGAARGYQTQLGKWFKDGRELSGGQWQKIALVARVHARGRRHPGARRADRAMDARAEAQVFEQFRELARERMVILISHRFSTVRMADQIVVIQGGGSSSAAATVA
jgi:ATP-binding cassette, subfamily B, bacterial